jgi:hypothetical protein
MAHEPNETGSKAFWIDNESIANRIDDVVIRHTGTSVLTRVKKIS